MTVGHLERAWETDGSAAAGIAGWLASVFIAPLPIDVVTEYCSADGARLLTAIGDEVGCKACTDQMRRALATRASPASIERELSISYTLMFEGVAGLGTVSLYESAYTGAGSRLFKQPTADMELLLHHYGHAVRQDCCEPPDHLSIELALLSAMLREDNRQSVAMLCDRLLTWVPHFAARCGEADEYGFYSGAAMLLNGFIATAVLHNARSTA
jgi:TorA-specific chaperone